MGEAERFLAVGAALFILGAIGFITRRNLIMIVLSAEMMLHGVSLTLVTFGSLHHTLEGQAFTIFALTVAGCEAGLALALILALFQESKSLDIDLWSGLREPDMAGPRSDAGSIPPAHKTPFPTLSPAGRAPGIQNQASATGESVVSPSGSPAPKATQPPRTSTKL